MILYHLLWTLIGGPLILGCRFYKKPRLRDRLAYNLPQEPLKPRGIWVHALSVGEVKSAIPLVDRIREKYPDKCLVFSSTSQQGLDLAHKELLGKVDSIITMPLDFWWSCNRVIETIRPNIFILVETDLWPGLLNLLKAKGIKSLLVNGRISDRTYGSYKRVPRLAQSLFRDLEVCLMQSEQDRRRLLSIGLPPHKVVTAGNIKFDWAWTPITRQEREQWNRRLGIDDQTKVWVAGSTHAGESRELLEVFFELQENYPNLMMILAPRKIQEAPDLCRMVKEKGKRCVLRSQLREEGQGADVIILDSIGELERVYGLGHISFVGGSLVPIGGHNLLEPASFGIPVLYGPHTSNFAWMAEGLSSNGGGFRVTNEHELKEMMLELLGNEQLRLTMGIAALSFVKAHQGALDVVMDYIEDCIDGS